MVFFIFICINIVLLDLANQLYKIVHTGIGLLKKKKMCVGTVFTAIKYAICLPLVFASLAVLTIFLAYVIKASELEKTDGHSIKWHFANFSFYEWDELFWWALFMTGLGILALFGFVFFVAKVREVYISKYKEQRSIQTVIEAMRINSRGVE